MQYVVQANTAQEMRQAIVEQLARRISSVQILISRAIGVKASARLAGEISALIEMKKFLEELKIEVAS